MCVFNDKDAPLLGVRTLVRLYSTSPAKDICLTQEFTCPGHNLTLLVPDKRCSCLPCPFPISFSLVSFEKVMPLIDFALCIGFLFKMSSATVEISDDYKTLSQTTKYIFQPRNVLLRNVK